MPNCIALRKVVLTARSAWLRISGNMALGTTFSHPANCRIEYTAVNPSAGNTDLYFRMQDGSNTWDAHINTAGTFALIEIIAGASNIRQSASGVVAGDRITLEMNGSTITGKVNGVVKWTRSTAANYQTAAAGKAQLVSAGIKDLAVFPLQ